MTGSTSTPRPIRARARVRGRSRDRRLGCEVAAVGDIACPTVSFCVEPYYEVRGRLRSGDHERVVLDRSGGRRRRLEALGRFIDGGVNGGQGGGDGRVAAFSCASTSLCAGADDGGRVLASSTPVAGSSWKAQKVDAGNSITDISCAPSSTTCVAVDSAGNVISTVAAAHRALEARAHRSDQRVDGDRLPERTPLHRRRRIT